VSERWLWSWKRRLRGAMQRQYQPCDGIHEVNWIANVTI
jgi:hypothetical protein